MIILMGNLEAPLKRRIYKITLTFAQQALQECIYYFKAIALPL
jgi:hypothetical protein